MNDELIVRARRVGNSIVLTAPTAKENQLYAVSETNNGRIIFSPVRITHAGDEPGQTRL